MREKKKISGLANVLHDGIVTLPEQVCNRLGLKPHDHLLFRLTGGHIVASKVKGGGKKYYADTGG